MFERQVRLHDGVDTSCSVIANHQNRIDKMRSGGTVARVKYILSRQEWNYIQPFRDFIAFILNLSFMRFVKLRKLIKFTTNLISAVNYNCEGVLMTPLEISVISHVEGTLSRIT